MVAAGRAIEPGEASSSNEALLPTRHRGLLMFGIMGAVVVQILDTTIANVALPHMETELGASRDTVIWVLTSYIVATAIALPATGWLSDRIGSRNLFLVSVVGFVLASMLCGTAVSLGEMVGFRELQGVFAAFINPLSQTALLDISRPEQQGKAMSVWGMGIMVGPISGPVIGGWLTDSFSWRWCFYVNVPIGALVFAILWWLLPSRPKARRRFDGLGFALIAIAVTAFQLLLDRGQDQDWFESREVIAECLVAIGFGWMAMVHLATARAPLFDRRLFANPNLVTGLVFMMLIGVSTMAPMALLPQMLQQLFGYPVIDAGLMMAPRGVGVLFTMWLSGQLIARVDSRPVIIVGLLIFAFSLRQMAGYSLAMDFWPVIVAGFMQGLGMGLVFLPLNSLAFATLDGRYRTDGSSLLNLMRSIGQSGGISMATVFLARNIQTSHADLAAHVTDKSIPGLNLGSLDQFGSLAGSAFAFADAAIDRQAAMIAYIDDFHLMAWIVIAMMPLVLLLRRPKGKMGLVHSE